ncbi:MAG TPA: hypothetical protein VNW97_23395 [Candidatus Saccharimonadales bacterium]|jgi:hypothetical protein|nr:hypothetical protein [Candidatus Saccharimonadales bacterium]
MIAHSDPERLREFAMQLKSYNEFIETMMASVRQGTRRLAQSWKDPQFDEFETVLERTRNLLVNFTMETNQTVELLKRDAQALEDAHSVRPPEGD